MNTRVDKNAVEYAIELLRALIELSPADSHNRLRLLKLLHVKGRRYDFVVEAHHYQANCDLTFDTDWNLVCQMGREINPGNGFFGKAPLVNRPQLKHQRPSGSPSAARTDSGQKEEPSAQTPEQQPKQEIPAPEPRNDGSNRRDSVERRMEDRRINLSGWFGAERRKYPQRQMRRRNADVHSRRIP